MSDPKYQVATPKQTVLDVTFPRPEEISDRETVSLFMMVKNAESCIGRLLANVGPYIDEVVVVLNDTTDGTRAIVERFCDEQKKECIVEEVTAKSHPEFYLLDTRDTYLKGDSLCGEEMAGPYMEAPILAKWADARNLGWKKCTKKWRLFLDADDLVSDPESIPGLCQTMTKMGLDQAATKYYFAVDADGRPFGCSYRERMILNSPDINWVFDIHEVLHGALRVSHVDGNLIVRDMRDNRGANIRIPGRNMKILYHLARSQNWESSPRTLVNLLMETRHMTEAGPIMYDFASRVLERYLDVSTWAEERAWACCITAEMFEHRASPCDLDYAVILYNQSLAEYPSPRSAWLLCRAYFKLGLWKASLEAYKLAESYKGTHQVLNDGPLLSDMSKILVAHGCSQLGLKKEALKYADQALAAFPDNLALIALRSQIERDGSEMPDSAP
jgi:tetratricopeptide (TPR) repeat protein